LVQFFHPFAPAGLKRYWTSNTQPATGFVAQITEKVVEVGPELGVVRTGTATVPMKASPLTVELYE